MLKWITRWLGSSRSAGTRDWLPALRPAWYAFKNREIGQAIKLAEPLTRSRNAVVAAQAERVLGLAYSRAGHYDDACAHLRLAAEGSDDALDWFNLANAAVLAEDPDLGDQAIDMAVSRPWRSPHIQTLSKPQMRFHYLQALTDAGHHERAFKQLDEIRKIYQRFHSTAHDLLQFKKVPFLKRVLDASVPTLRVVKVEYDVDRWLDDFSEKLDRGGRDLVEQVRRKVHAEIGPAAADPSGPTGAEAAIEQSMVEPGGGA